MNSRTVADRIATAARMLDMRVQVTEHADWDVRETGEHRAAGHPVVVNVGTGLYSRANLRGDALTAAIILDLWATVHLARSSPQRTRMRSLLSTERPDLTALLDTIDRLQAGAEMLIAMPGLHEGLTTSVHARFAADLREAPEPTQLLAHTLLSAFAPDARYRVSPRVAALRVPDNTLRIAMTPCNPPDPARTFVRLLACLLEPYETLTAASETGLGDSRDGREGAAGEGDDALSNASGEISEETAVPEHTSANRNNTDHDPDERAGEAAHSPEPEHLYEVTPHDTVTAMLETPLAPTEAAIRALSEADAAGLPETQATARHASPGDTRSHALHTVRLTKYLERYAALEPEVMALRDVWQQLISERLTAHSRFSRTPVSEGEMLFTRALPSALAQARAGTPRPNAFATRERHHRNREDFGNLDVVLLIDRSGSMRHTAQAAADAALVMTEALAAVSRDARREERKLGIDLNLEVRTALIVFDAEPVVLKPLSAGSDDTVRARLYVEALASGGGTDDAAALEEAARQLGLLARENGSGQGVQRRRLVVMVSDGGSQEPDRADALVKHLRSRGVTVFGIGVRSDALVERYRPSARRVDDARDIVGVLESLIAETAMAE